MKKSPIPKVSKKQKVELARRRKLKKELIEEFGERCMRCGNLPDFRGLQLVHKDPIGMGGRSITRTTRENCELQCAPCHFGPGGHRTEGMKGVR